MKDQLVATDRHVALALVRLGSLRDWMKTADSKGCGADVIKFQGLDHICFGQIRLVPGVGDDYPAGQSG